MNLKIAKFEISFIDDPFLRPSLSIYCCGCWHRCKNCQNKELQDYDNPNCKELSIDQIISKVEETKDLIESVVYLGGDFGYFLDDYFELSGRIKKFNLFNVLYTGFLKEDLPSYFLRFTDVLIDGKYLESKNQSIFPASSNQRVWVNKNGNWTIIDPHDLPINRK